MKYLLFILVISLGLFNSSGQPLPIVERDGQKFYQFELQTNQSLHDLQKLLEIDIDELLTFNPGLERGPQAGNQILIPVRLGRIQHQVEAQQTLYAISRMYGVSIDSLKAWNPTANDGLKIGQTLRVEHQILPFDVSNGSNPSITEVSAKIPKLSDTIITHTVTGKETMYTISKRYMVPINTLLVLNHLNTSKLSAGQQIIIPVNKNRLQHVSIQKVPDPLIKNNIQFPVFDKEVYNIAVFLPFELDKDATSNSFISNAALDFYMGLKIAADSLEQRGLSANIFVYDEKNLTPSLDVLLQKDEMQHMDLIFSPLFKESARIVADFARLKQIPVVFPVQMPDDIVQLAPNFMTYTTTESVLVQNLASYIHEQFKGHTIVLIPGKTNKELQLDMQFRSAFYSQSTSQSKVKLHEGTLDNYQKFKAFGAPLLLVSFTTEPNKALKLLSIAALDTSIHIAGQKDWADFKELREKRVMDQPFLVAMPSYFNYKDPQTIAFHKVYRRKYNADLTKMSCLGYDVFFQTGMYLLGHKNAQEGLISNLQFDLNVADKHLENRAARVIWYKNSLLMQYE